jgi:hypothetical protein
VEEETTASSSTSERHRAGPPLQALALALDAVVTQHSAQRGTAEREHADRLVPPEPTERVFADLVDSVQNGLFVAGHHPRQAAWVDRAAPADGPALEVDLGRQVAGLDAAAPLHAEGTRQHIGGEGRRVRVGLRRRVHPLQVDIERRPVVESQHPPVGGARHDHRLADRVVAMADPHRDRRLGRDGHTDHRVGEHAPVLEEVRPVHPPAVSRGAAEERGARTQRAIGPTHNALLVADQAIGEQHHDPVRLRDVSHAGRDLVTRVGLATGDVLGRASDDLQPGAAYRGHGDRAVRGPADADLAVRGAPDDRHPWRRPLDTGQHGRGVMGDGREHDQQLRVGPGLRRAHGRARRRARIGQSTPADAQPAPVMNLFAQDSHLTASLKAFR